ncbi:NTMT1 family protein [Megaselia abdita]
MSAENDASNEESPSEKKTEDVTNPGTIRLIPETKNLENIKISDEESSFYTDAKDYWSNIPATLDGMLGGFGYISSLDLNFSERYIRDILKSADPPQRLRALDCGAGIGRISKNLLMKHFETVDLVEQDQKFSEEAKVYCSSSDDSAKRLGTVYNVGLQKFTPEPNTYDLIWSQWVLGHLTDEDLLEFFKRIKVGLKETGAFVIKENVTKHGTVEKDEDDSSITRPLKTYETILKNAGFKVTQIVRQTNLPQGLFPVYLMTCRPKKKKAIN